MQKPMLSICIPTYNRADYLRDCLREIVKQDGFDERVEVVISDNASSDNTEEIGRIYQDKFSNIHYFRNEKNVVDMNYPLVFQRANGTFRKLTNDTIRYKPGAIDYLLKAVEDNIDRRPQLYFLNSHTISSDKKEVNSLEDYIGTLGYHITWIASFGIWEEECDGLDVLVEKAESRLAQVPFLIQNFEKHGTAVIHDKIIMESVIPKKKNLTYGLYNIFYDTFLGFIKPYLIEEKISKECYESLRKTLLLDFFAGWIVNKENDNGMYRFSNEDLQGLVEAEYKDESYFDEYKSRLRKLRVKAKIKKCLGR